MNWEQDELAKCIERGNRGDGAAARRAAEIYELFDDYRKALVWWCRAAALEDADAILYVQLIREGKAQGYPLPYPLAKPDGLWDRSTYG